MLVNQKGIKASLYVTCIIDQLYPQVGVSVVNVLRKLGVQVEFPIDQSCCGQPLFNSGYVSQATELAARVIESFRDSEYVVVPSGSCAAMFREFYPTLFESDPTRHKIAQEFSERVYEFSEFLVEVLGVNKVNASGNGKHTFHTSCHMLRELGVKDQPLSLLEGVQGIETVDLPQREVCCGFGGTFSVKYPHISEEMLSDKIDNVLSTSCDTLVSCDMSCLMNIGGALSRNKSGINVKHLAEILDEENN